MQTDDRGTALEQGLDAMHAAVLAGDLAALPRLGAEVDALVAQTAGLGDAALVLRLKDKAARNAACLSAAIRGLRAARRRLSEIRAARAGLAAYDGQGRRVPIAPDGGHLTRRF